MEKKGQISRKVGNAPLPGLLFEQAIFTNDHPAQGHQRANLEGRGFGDQVLHYQVSCRDIEVGRPVGMGLIEQSGNLCFSGLNSHMQQ